MATRARKFRYNESDTLSSKLPSLLERWNINFTSRRDLLELTDQQLRDIGIDRIMARQEARKPFWRN